MITISSLVGSIPNEWAALSKGGGLIVPAARPGSRTRAVLRCPAMSRIAGWLLFLLVIIGAGAKSNAQSVALAWNPCSDPTVTGYVMYWGAASGDYTNSEDAGPVTAITISGLAAGTTYYFAVTCYNAAGLQSAYSAEVSYTMPEDMAADVTNFSFANLVQTYNGAPESVTVTTSPPGQPVIVTYNGSAAAPVYAGAYTVVAMPQNSGSASATNTFIINPAPATVTLSGLTLAYTGSAQTATVNTSPPGLAATTTYNGNAAAPANAGSYTVVSIVNDPNYTGSATGSLVISPAPATVTLSGLALAYNGSAQTATVTTSPPGLATTTTYNGNAAAPSSAGSYTVVSMVNDPNYTGSATGTLVISPAPATVALSGLTLAYTGSPQTATVTTSPPGLATTTTYNGSTAAPTSAGSYTVVSMVNDPNYTGSATGTLVIKPVYTVTTQVNPAGAGSVIGGGSYVAGSSVTVTATANSGYVFANWTANGTVQSTSPNYSFTPAASLSLAANFASLLPVVNGSFESPAVSQGAAGGVPDGWLVANEDPCGVYNPADGVYTNEVNDILPPPADGSQLLWIKSGNYVAQFLTNTLEASQTYTLSGAIGNRGDGDGMGLADQAYVNLVAGDTFIAQNSDLPHPAPGTFLAWTISYTAPATGFPSGPLQIRLGQNGAGEVDFDNIVLTMTAPAGTTPLAPSTTTVASSQNPALAGSVVTLTATVGGNGGIPTGSVSFYDGTNNLGAATLDSVALAALSTTGLSAGGSPHSITAVYSGDSAFCGSTSSALSQIITNTIPGDTGDPAPGASTTITLDNDNFAIPAGAQGTVEGQPAGWVAANQDPYGVYNPAVGVYLNETNDILPAPVGSSQLLWIEAGNYVAQFLTNTLVANQTYTLSGAIGNRGDGYGMLPTDQAYVDLVAGNTVIAQIADLPHPAPGTFLAWTISYTAPAAGFPSGPLQIRLGQDGAGEVDFGNITLTMTAPAITADAMALAADATASTTNTTASTTTVTAAILKASPVAAGTAQATPSTYSSIPNPFASVAGTFHGLFCVPNAVAEESSGAIRVTVTGTGAFSAQLRMDAGSCPFSGQFSTAGVAVESIPRAGLNPLTVQLQLSLTNGPLTGTVSDGTWTADLLAEPAVYSSTNPAPQAGQYTLLIPGSGDASAQTGGSGSGVVTVSGSGDAAFSGSLGDGTPVTSAGTVTGWGQWPFYLSLSGGQGSIFGWLSITNPGSAPAAGTTGSGSSSPSPAQ